MYLLKQNELRKKKMKHKNIKVGMTIQNKKTMTFYKVMQCDFDNDFYLDDFYTDDCGHHTKIICNLHNDAKLFRKVKDEI